MIYDFFANIDQAKDFSSTVKQGKFLREEVDTIQMWNNPDDKTKKRLRENWKRTGARDTLKAYLNELNDLLVFIDPAKEIIDIKILPRFSCLLQFVFTLEKPFISKDDGELHLYDNPICREKIFRTPMVRPSTWKGNLRFAFRQITEDRQVEEISKIEKRLFGNLKTETEQDKFRRGRLYFYPTFFRKIDFEVITPLNRKKRVPTDKGPIFFEAVKENAKGTFKLLYIPFDLIGKPDLRIKEEVKQDMDTVFESIKEMMLTYGFSAKKSSGFGIIREEFPECGLFRMKGFEKEFKNFPQLDKVVEKVTATLSAGQ